MKMRREKEGKGAIVFEEIEPFFLGLLRRLPANADPGDDPAARARLFSAPMNPGGDGDEFNEDWRQLVEPELRALFRSAHETVVEDLAGLPKTGDGETAPGSFDPTAFEPTAHSLRIPAAHSDAWLSVLNQARLVIAAKRGFGEEAMGEDLPFPPFSERDLDLFLVHFYDFIQQRLLREMGYD